MPRREHGSEDRLKKAALDSFDEQGFDNTSVIQISERAGVTTRTFFRYFSDKREVLFAQSDELRAATGLFEMHSQGWQPINLPPPPPGASGTGAEFANLSTLSAVLSSFGLQLRREEESLPFYTVERIDQPDAR